MKIAVYNDEGVLILEGELFNDYLIKGKEYIKGNLEYEGKYLYNRKFHGKGYDKNGDIIFDLKDGNGKVKEYNLIEKYTFEGQYLNGFENGLGKIYNINGNLILEGEFLNGLLNGKVKVYYKNSKLSFESKYIDNNRNVKGKEYNYKGLLIFEGEYLNDKRNGKGKEFDNHGKLIYEGEYKYFLRKEK